MTATSPVSVTVFSPFTAPGSGCITRRLLSPVDPEIARRALGGVNAGDLDGADIAARTAVRVALLAGDGTRTNALCPRRR